MTLTCVTNPTVELLITIRVGPATLLLYPSRTHTYSSQLQSDDDDDKDLQSVNISMLQQHVN